jgi:3-dehydroquinate dehydratase type I
MIYAPLGRTGLKVSRLCLGTMNFGPETSEADAHDIMDRALDLGLNFFDTANVYGWKIGEGVTEQIIGRWLARGGGRRDRIVLATKVYGKMGEGPNDGRLSALHIRAAVEGSLRRLQTDHIDLYQLHHVDRETPWEEIWQAMELLVQQGKVVYVGSSNLAGWHLARASELAARRGFLGLVSEQSKYSLVERTIELEVIPACRAYGIGLIPYSPLASGTLARAGRAGGGAGRRGGKWAQDNEARYGAKLEAFGRFCAELGEEPADVAVAWLLANPVVTAPIIGPRTREQLDGAPSARSSSASTRRSSPSSTRSSPALASPRRKPTPGRVRAMPSPPAATAASAAPWLVGVVSSPEAVARFAGTPAGARVVDLLEVRVDLFDAPSIARWAEAGARIEASGTPVLATIRLEAEGGRWTGTDAERLALYREALASGACSWVDVEEASAIAHDVTALARARGATSIVSHHDFARTPPPGALERIVAACREAGADVPKVATKVNAEEDRVALLALAAAHAGRACVIGMGQPELRVELPARGSRLAYAYVDAPTAPGQLSAAEMDARLRAAVPSYAARRAA